MNFKSCSVALAMLSAVPLAGCSTTRERVRFTACISDPLAQSIHCMSPRAEEYSINFKHTDGFVCMPPHDFKALFQESRRK